MNKINFVLVFLAITLAIDVIIPLTVTEVNQGIGFALFIGLAVILGFASGTFGFKLNDYFRNQ